MCEILRDNFEEHFPNVVESLKRAAVIAIDAEFSGLLVSSNFKSSLFDSANERYKKLRENIAEVLILQIGVTTFIFDREKNSYSAKTFCFYLIPRSIGSIDTVFRCQASSFEFLCHHNLDFNKVVYQGVSFLNEVQCEDVQRELSEGHLFRLLERSLSIKDEEVVQMLCSQVALWLAGGNPGEGAAETSLLLLVPKSSQSSQCISYVVHHELRQRFPSVWTVPESGNVKVLKVSVSERSFLERSRSFELEMQTSVLTSLQGFSRVFKEIVSLKKPIIGHNLLLDLMIMHKQFYRPLPKSYTSFKSSILSLFPMIYDTKYMSSELKKKLRKADWWQSNALDHLYKYFVWGKGSHLVSCSPLMSSQDYGEDNSLKFHDAGWDSYCAGYCFIQMAHFFATCENGRLSLARPLTSTEHVALTAPLRNRVNIIRGNVSHIVLDGPDPSSHRPELFIIKSKNGKKLDIIALTEKLSKFGSVDVKSISTDKAIVASSSFGIVRDVAREFSTDRNFVVVPYSAYQHSSLASIAKMTGILAGFGLFSYFCYRCVSKGDINLFSFHQIDV